MAQNIGSFGKIVQKAVEVTESKPEYDLISYCGQDIRLAHTQNSLVMMQMSDVINDAEGKSFIPATAAIYSVLRESILPDDWSQFERLSKANEVSIPELSELAERLYIWWSNRPFTSASGSSTGQETPETKAPSSEPSSVVSVELPPQDSSDQSTVEPEGVSTA